MFNLESCALAADGSAARLLETPVGPGLRAFSSGEYFVCAEPDGQINCSRIRVGSFETFLLCDVEHFATLEFIVENKWLRRLAGESIDVTDVELLPDFKLRVGRVVLPISEAVDALRGHRNSRKFPREICLNFDGWKLDRYVLYRPLAYFVAYGNDEIFDCMEMAIRSLFELGDWMGDVMIVTDHEHLDFPERLPVALKERIHIVAFLAGDVLDYTLARYKIAKLEIVDYYQPIIYIDVDVICDSPIEGFLKSLSFSSLLEVCPEGPLGQEEDYFGNSLLKEDGTGCVFGDVGMSSGIFAFKDIQDQKQTFDLLCGTADRWSASTGKRRLVCYDQPFLNYILYKTSVQYGTRLDKIVHNHANHRPALAAPVGKGLVHFPGGVGNSAPKLIQMRNYISILESHRNTYYP
jgi:hypothetical protein